MTMQELLFALGGLSITIIGYFLKKTLNELEKIKEVAYDNRSKIKVMENDYINKINALNDRFDMLADNIKELTQEIKNLTQRIK